MERTEAATWIRALDLRPHPEGGWYRETYRAAESIPRPHLPPRFDGARAFSTAIYFLLERGQHSALHRIRQDEVWLFHDGDALLIHQLAADGHHGVTRLGCDPAAGAWPQWVVPGGTLFGAELAPQGAFALVSCTVAPGFDFADFELPSRAALRARFPQHAALIERLGTPPPAFRSAAPPPAVCACKDARER